MWPFKRKTKPASLPPGSFIAALQRKDAKLYDQIRHLPIGQFWREWKKVHPEDFPLDGASPISARSVVE